MINKVPHIRPDKSLPMPKRTYAEDAGSDLHILEDITIFAGQTVEIPVNTRILLPPGFFACVTGRSGLAKKGLLVHLGTIDAGYTGVIKVIATNLTKNPMNFKRGDRIAQLVIHNVYVFEFEEVDEFPETSRGENGIGSTGISD